MENTPDRWRGNWAAGFEGSGAQAKVRYAAEVAPQGSWAGFLAALVVIAGCGSTGGAAPGQGGTGGGVGGFAGSFTAAAGGSGSGAAAGASGSGAAAGGSGTGGAAADSGSGGAAGSGTAAGGAGGVVSSRPFDMNDVTILAPLPRSTATPVLLRATDLADDNTPLVPRVLFDQVARDRNSTTGAALPLLDMPYERLQLVAVRFDLCDRHQPGPCPDAEDARMRLVFQPLTDAPTSARDIGFHAFYAIRNDEIPGALGLLRELAMMAPAQPGPLRVSPALSASDPEPYASKLRAFVRRYGGEARLARLTMNAQDLQSEAFAWVLQGIEKQAGAFVDMPIVGATQLAQRVILGSAANYDVVPVIDQPPGFRSTLSQAVFDRADATQKPQLLAALAAVENPLSQTSETVACVTCHVSTVVMATRASAAAIDPLALPGRYTSTFDLSIAGGQSTSTPQTLRALGYFRTVPLISQRVVNETAQTLTEIAQRFPGP